MIRDSDSSSPFKRVTFSMNKTAVFLLDDHKIVRDGLKSILANNDEFEVIGEESNPESFLKVIQDVPFDLLVMDISLPATSGIDLIQKVKNLKPASKIIMLSMHDNPEYMFKSLKEGANAYLSKDIEADEFIEALKQVSLKGSYFPTHIRFNTKEKLTPSPEGSKQSVLLSNREIEILGYMARGKSSREIAETLTLSPRTVETHRVNIMKKLGTSNSAETVAMALKLNLIQKGSY
jgi:DNA-binding NarL/FixJ family response regulator